MLCNKCCWMNMCSKIFINWASKPLTQLLTQNEAPISQNYIITVKFYIRDVICEKERAVILSLFGSHPGHWGHQWFVSSAEQRATAGWFYNLYPFFSWQTFGLFGVFNHYFKSCSEDMNRVFHMTMCFNISCVNT